MKKFLILCLILATLVITACDDGKLESEYADQKMDPLPQGTILKISLVYKINEEDENSSEWYKVELQRNDKAWKDSVKLQGISRDTINHWDDYEFYSKNFNQQIENEAFGIDSLDGDYTLTITGSNGYNESYELIWQNGQWTNIDSARTFYVE